MRRSSLPWRWPAAVLVGAGSGAWCLLASASGAAGLAVPAAVTTGALTAWLVAVRGRRVRRLEADLAEMTRLADVRADQVSMVSHEIRTPLATVKAAAGVLADGAPGALTARQREFISTIVQQCDQAVAIAEDLLLQARLDAGHQRIQPIEVNVGRLVRETVAALRPLSAERGQLLSSNLPRLDPQAVLDARLFRQALTNLLTNAVRHTAAGERVVVSLAADDAHVVVSVTDGGSGMDRAERARLFRPFATGADRPAGAGDEPAGRTGLGTSVGLGLVLTRRIAELHGGALLVDTSPRRGTTVMMTFPVPPEQRAGAR